MTRTIDRNGWPAGPWDDEEDRYEWRDPSTGLACLARRNRMGNWCGYVAVPAGHAWHGVEYQELDELEVHGGLTYAAGCDLEAGICHEPLSGEDGEVWWLGFDCAHMTDLIPYMVKLGMVRDEDWPLVYRDIAYVRGECAGLAAQVVAAG